MPSCRGHGINPWSGNEDPMCCRTTKLTPHCHWAHVLQGPCATTRGPVPQRKIPHATRRLDAAKQINVHNKQTKTVALMKKKKDYIQTSYAFLVAQRVKRLPEMQETWVWNLGREDPLEKEMATHSSTLAWKIPWMEQPGRLQPMGSQWVRHDWATLIS